MFGFGRKSRTGADGARSVTRQEFLTQVAAGTGARRDYTHMYLMLEPGGVIGVQWERPGKDRLERYRIIDPQLGSCPHCAILTAVGVLAEVLPLDSRRHTSTCSSYEMYLRMGKLPCPAFGVRNDRVHPLAELGPSFPTAGWVADCHAADGDPHTAWDCEDHAQF